MPLNTSRFEVRPTNGIFLFVWDEYDPGSALNRINFRRPHGDDTGRESQVEVDTGITDFSPSEAVLRDIIPLRGSDTATVKFASERTGNSVPDKAVRVIAAVNRGSACDVDPFRVRLTEGF
jgi:hypothetical protein